jgi:DNA-directed RNA polymerase sigma subunit (sigma70/sigma32)
MPQWRPAFLSPEFAFCKLIIEEYKEVFILFEDEQASIKRIVGQVKDENESAIKELLEQFAPLIRNTAFTAFETTGFSGLEVNDLISVGNFAIYNAAKSYQQERGPFPAYAKLLVRRSIWNYLRENMASSHSLLNEAHSLDEYREYNPHNGNHNWTLNPTEHKQLVKLGWKDEGVAWYANPAGPVTVYRLYNPHSGEHVYTTSAKEYAAVGKAGWHQEGTAWKGL